MKILIIYYSLYGHIHRLAKVVAEGVRETEGAEAVLRRVPETLQGKHVASIALKLTR
jgi:NAD(P)H dehydrogenase (quinone)